MIKQVFVVGVVAILVYLGMYFIRNTQKETLLRVISKSLEVILGLIFAILLAILIIIGVVITF